jgi:hypothetical protein
LSACILPAAPNEILELSIRLADITSEDDSPARGEGRPQRQASPVAPLPRRGAYRVSATAVLPGIIFYFVNCAIRVRSSPKI